MCHSADKEPEIVSIKTIPQLVVYIAVLAVKMSEQNYFVHFIPLSKAKRLKLENMNQSSAQEFVACSVGVPKTNS